MTDFKQDDLVRVDPEGYGYYSGTSNPWPIARQIVGIYKWDGMGVVVKARDAEGDVDVDIDGGKTIYVRPEFIRHVEENSEETNMDKSEPQLDGVWVAYAIHDVVDSVTFTVHASEIDALRYAVSNGGQVKRLGYGEEMDI